MTIAQQSTILLINNWAGAKIMLDTSKSLRVNDKLEEPGIRRTGIKFAGNILEDPLKSFGSLL